MKTIIFGTALSLGLAPMIMADTATNQLTDEKSRVSYAIGMMNGRQWQQQGLDIDPDVYVRGIKDMQSGGTPLMTTEQAQETLQAFSKEFKIKQQQMQAEKGAKNKTEGEAFLVANKNNPGVVTLPDGLQYVVLTNGTGPIPSPSDTVSVNYRGTLIDGTEFDSSYKRGQPAQFPVGGVIHGWTEALEKMNVGSKWKLFIPAQLAYGERGQPPTIAPNAVLIFEVELLEIKAQTPPSPTAAAPQPLTSDIIKVPSAEEMKKGAKIEVIKPEDAQKMQSGQGQ